MSRPLRVVVTRPAGQADALRDALIEADFEAVALPVMAIEPVAGSVIKDALTDAASADLLIFVSINAVRFALDHLPHADTLNATTVAVGPSTARALEDAGYPCGIVPDSGFTSEALLAEAALREVAGKRVLIVRGTGGRALLGDTLRERGAQVSYAEIYRRDLPQQAGSDLQQALAEGFDAVTATSVETLLNLDELAGPEHVSLLHDVKVVTASDRVLKKAQVLGYTQDVLLANAPDDGALVDALKKWRASPPTAATPQSDSTELEPPASMENAKMAADTNKPDDHDDATFDAPVDEPGVKPDGEPETVDAADTDGEPAVIEQTVTETVETVSESAPMEAAAVAAAPAEPAKGGRGVALLALLLSAGAIALAAMAWLKTPELPEFPAPVEVEDPSIALNAVADTLRSDVNAVRDDVQRTASSLRSDMEREIKSLDLTSVSDEVNDIAGQQTTLSRRLSGQERSITTVTDRLAGIESNMNAMQGVSDSVRNTWVRAEAEYFLQTANSRLQLAGDVNSALSALRAADERIGALGDPGLIKVRAKITEEILAVEAVPQPDIEGLALVLLGMSERVAALPIEKGDITTRYEPTPSDVDPDELSGLDRAKAKVAGAFAGIVRVTPDDGNITAIMAPEDAYFIYRNLELNLTIARLALMRQDTENFKGSLTTASRWLEQHFVNDDPGVSKMITRINDMAETPINPDLPDISDSLRMLRALVAASSTSP
ncbi:MAG: uroporphyrinogen-III C-methyltransferase [Gammaproteobacteria bacterium]